MTLHSVSTCPLLRGRNIVTYRTPDGLEFQKDLPAIGTDIRGNGNGEKMTKLHWQLPVRWSISMSMTRITISDKRRITDKINTLRVNIHSAKFEVFVNTRDDEKTGCVTSRSQELQQKWGDDGIGRPWEQVQWTYQLQTDLWAWKQRQVRTDKHVGKLYNLLSNQIANDIATNVSGIEDVYIRILSQIGHP